MRLAVVLCAVSCLWHATARAQPLETEPPASKKTHAVALANQGYVAYTEGRFAEAARFFEQAEATQHAPTFLAFLAQAEVALGKLASARRHYRAVVAEPLDAGSPFR